MKNAPSKIFAFPIMESISTASPPRTPGILVLFHSAPLWASLTPRILALLLILLIQNCEFSFSIIVCREAIEADLITKSREEQDCVSSGGELHPPPSHGKSQPCQVKAKQLHYLHFLGDPLGREGEAGVPWEVLLTRGQDLILSRLQPQHDSRLRIAPFGLRPACSATCRHATPVIHHAQTSFASDQTLEAFSGQHVEADHQIVAVDKLAVPTSRRHVSGIANHGARSEWLRGVKSIEGLQKIWQRRRGATQQGLNPLQGARGPFCSGGAVAQRMQTAWQVTLRGVHILLGQRPGTVMFVLYPLSGT
mmetsp:Transcript_26459/g.36538  ORF Transcript_26459/g.36538 Transcript_26459/m.36538 type:complete len:307 (+) Transcript_26459:170-1090(+)